VSVGRADLSLNTHPEELSSERGELTETSADWFIQSLGLKVLAARKNAKMSRRLLSEKSGVSQRTIVLLETGKGNISVGLLFKVAEALGVDIVSLLCPDKFEHAKILVERFEEASPTVQQKVMSLLLPEQLAARKRQRVCLIGLRGAGKSTLGRMLSESLSLPFLELNREIESLCGMSVAELMSLYGPEGYRRLELQALEQLVETEGPLLFEAAGGVVSEPVTYELLLANFYTVWLKATPEDHMARVIRQGDARLVPRENSGAMKELKSILTSREALYAAADFMIDTSLKTLDEVHETVFNIIVKQVQS